MSFLFNLLHALSTLAGGAGSAQQPVLQQYEVDSAASQIYVIVHRAGLLSFLGHEHAVVPPDWSASLCLAEPIPAGAHGALTIRTGSLVIDSDEARALAHLEGGPNEDQRREIHDLMVDADHLDVERYPEIRLEVDAARAQSDGQVAVTGTITLHGVTRRIELPVLVDDGVGGRLVLRGTLRIRQRDFGIEPESKAGLVKVANEVDLLFLLQADPTERPCLPSGA